MISKVKKSILEKIYKEYRADDKEFTRILIKFDIIDKHLNLSSKFKIGIHNIVDSRTSGWLNLDEVRNWSGNIDFKMIQQIKVSKNDYKLLFCKFIINYNKFSEEESLVYLELEKLENVKYKKSKVLK